MRGLFVILSFVAQIGYAEPYAQQQDKREHMGFSTAITFVSSLALWQTEYPVLYGSLIGLGIGLGKELSDRRAEGNHFSLPDLTADALGVAIGASGAYWILTPKAAYFKLEF